LYCCHISSAPAALPLRESKPVHVIKVYAHICWVSFIAGLGAWREEIFGLSQIFTMIPCMISKAIYNFDHTRLQFFTHYRHEVKNEKCVALAQHYLFFQ